jgi:hypothetical protein
LLKEEERHMCIVKIFWVVFLSVTFVLYCSDTWAREPLWFSYSSSYTVVKRTQPSFKRRLMQWTAWLIFSLLCWGLHRLEPLIASDIGYLQPPLDAWQDPLVKDYEQIFEYFDFSVLPVPKRGPKRNTFAVYAKVFLIKVNEHLQTSSALREFFLEHPQSPPENPLKPISPSTHEDTPDSTINSRTTEI